MSTSFQIRFIRKTNSTDSQSDDTITVRQNPSNDEFIMTFKDADGGCDNLPLYHTLSMDRDRLLNHMYVTLKNQVMDDDGFESLQFNMPAMPRLLVSVSRFSDSYYREHFLDLIENAMDCISPQVQEEEWICNDCTAHLEAHKLHAQASLDADIAEMNARKARAVAKEAIATKKTAEVKRHSRPAETHLHPQSIPNCSHNLDNSHYENVAPPCRRSQRLRNQRDYSVRSSDPFEA